MSLPILGKPKQGQNFFLYDKQPQLTKKENDGKDDISEPETIGPFLAHSVVLTGEHEHIETDQAKDADFKVRLANDVVNHLLEVIVGLGRVLLRLGGEERLHRAKMKVE